MSRTHYEAIAEIIRKAKKREVRTVDCSTTQDYITKEMAKYFKKQNPKFSKEKFFDACCNF